MKLDIPKALAARVREHFGDVTPETVIEAVDYACNRKDALAAHADKVRKVKAAKEAGRKLPSVHFRRYLPAFADPKLAAEGTPREVSAALRTAAKGKA